MEDKVTPHEEPLMEMFAVHQVLLKMPIQKADTPRIQALDVVGREANRRRTARHTFCNLFIWISSPEPL